MSDLDDKLIIEAMSRRGFLGTLGKAAAAAGLSPKLPIPNLKDDDDDEDDILDDYERFDFSEWFEFNVRDIIIDDAIGDNKISNPLADKIELMVMDKITQGGQLSKDLMNLFDKHLERSNDKFYENLEDPEFVEDLVSDLSFEVIKQLGLKQLFASAARREQRGDKQEDILKDAKAKIDNPIEYSKFDTAGGTKEYNYTADSYIMSNKDGKMLSEAYLNEIAFAKNVNYNDEDRVKDTLHDISDRKDKKKWKFDPLDPESEDGYHEESEESLKKIIDKTFALNLPGLDEINEDIAHLDMFVSYDRKVFKLLKITGLNQYRVMGTYSDPTELRRDIRSIQLENL